MALKNLSVEEMIQVSDAWVTPENPAHGKLVAVPRLKGLLADLKEAHGSIFAVAPEPDNPRKAEIAQLATEEDALHDTLARGIYGCLTEMALLDDDGSSLIDLRDELMPEGLAKAVQNTYRGQAGFAALLRERLTPTTKDRLRAIKLRQGDLLALVEAWLAAGERLGKLEEERARLEQQGGTSLGLQTVQARNRWIRAVNALVSVAALAELDEATDRILFAPLRDAEAKAERRSAQRSPEELPEAIEPATSEPVT